MKFSYFTAVVISACVAVTSCFAQVAKLSAPSAAIDAYGSLPLLFEANEGQSDSSVQFLSRGQGYTLFLRQDEAVMVLGSSSPSQQQSDSQNRNTSLIRMKLVGANRLAKFNREDKQITTTNYFLGKNPAQWHTGISNYGRICYQSVYDGIDQVYYGNQRQLEHDFIVHPQADPSQIVLAFQGAKKIRIDSSTGDLVLDTDNGALRLRKPLAYQEETDRSRTEIPSTYKLLAGNKVSFLLEHYDRARELTIDPVLTYSTYLGGTGAPGDQANGIAVDAQGEAFVIGTTYSSDFPVTNGSFQTANNATSGLTTVFVSKLNASGTALLYSTYLGGSGGDFGYGIALDASDNAYVTGATRSKDFPITCGAYQATYPSTTSGATVAFVARLVADGSALSYSTYLGGTGNQSSALGDVGQAIAVDPTGNAYISGYTYSSDFPVSDKAFQTKYAGTAATSNAFVTKLNPLGTSLLYSTYLGGGGVSSFYGPPTVGDYANAIAIDSSGDAYVAGTTGSDDFPVTSAAFHPTLLGPSNAFVTELNPSGTAEVYSTYLGGTGQLQSTYVFNPFPATGDSATAIAIDTTGNAYVAGNTTSADFPVTAGVLEGASSFDATAAFVTKLSPGGSTLQYSTYLEGVGTAITGLAVDSSGTAYITGNAPTLSAGFPGGFLSTADALTPPLSSGTSAFIVKLNPTATTLNFATLLGGSSNDGATAIAVDSAGNVYVTGQATSADFPITTGAFQSTNKQAGKGGNAFVSQLALASETSTTSYPALPSGIATTLTANGPGQINLLYCDPSGTSANSFSLAVGATLTPVSAGPPLTGLIVFTDSFNYNFPNPYATQIYDDWSGGPVGLSFTDGVPSDGPVGPFDVSWTINYYGDAVYSGSTVSGTASSPGCPAQTNTGSKHTGVTPTRHFEFTLSTPRGIYHSAGVAASSNRNGAKFTPTAAAAQKLSETSIGPSEVTPKVTGCLAPPQTATPVLSVGAGTYTSVQSITITEATPGAAIYYTTDGTTPSASSTQYTSPISVGVTETIQAIAVAPGYTASTVASAAYTINLPPVTFSVTVSPSSLTIARGQSGTANISVMPQNGFASATTFSCSGLPSGVTCTFAPATVTPNGGVATTSLAVTASLNVSSLPDNSHSPLSPKLAGPTLAIALCCLSWKKRRTLRIFLLAFAALSLGATTFIGCGGKSTPKPVTSTVTVTATSGSIQQTVPLSITIQ